MHFGDQRQRLASSAAALLVAAVALAFFPALQNGFTGWDDSVYVTANPLLRDFTPRGLVAILTTPVSGNWHPLTILSLSIGHHLFGEESTSHLAVNLALHAGTCLLALRLFVSLGIPRWAALGAVLLWAVHPARTEAVAWIPGRKDLLAAFFSVAALLAWVGRRETGGRGRYLLSLGAFAAALLSKGTTTTLPVVMLLAEVIRGRRLDRRALAEIAPFLLLAAPVAWAAVAARASYQQALQEPPLELFPRLGLGLHRLVWYHLARLAVPTPLDTLNPFYSTPGDWFPAWPSLAGAVSILAAAGAGVFLLARRRRDWAFGPLFFLVTLAPTLVVTVVGHTADRFSYLPSLGFFHVAATAAGSLRSTRHCRAATAAISAAALVLVPLSRKECRAWRDGVAVWGRAVALYPSVPLFHSNFGNALAEAGDPARAVPELELAVAMEPATPYFLYNLANALAGAGDLRRAIAAYGEALALDPTFDEARVNRAVARDRAGDPGGALRDLDEVLARHPGAAVAWDNRGVVLGGQGNYHAAEESFSRALAADPFFINALVNRGAARFELGDTVGARADWEQALRLNPAREDARALLAGKDGR